jgi:co-chaperonin GroES (HSP10)
MNFKPVGKWVQVKTYMGGQKTTEAGIVYNDKPTGRYVVSEVVAVGSAVVEDIKVGDTIWWDPKDFRGDEYNGTHLVSEKWIALVERN